MRFVRPYVDGNRQVVFVESENQAVQDLINGALLALVVIGPIALVTPSII